jgi:hypothetical protein
MLSRFESAQRSSQEVASQATQLREALNRAERGASVLEGQLNVTKTSDPVSAAGATVAAFAAIVGHAQQLAQESEQLVQAAKDARLAGSAQVARAQDLTAAAHTLARSCAKTAATISDIRTAELSPAAAADA